VKARKVKTSYLRNPVQRPNQISVEMGLLEELLSCYRSTWDRYTRSEIDILRDIVEKKKANNVEDAIIGINLCFDALEEVASRLPVSKLEMSAEEYDYSIETLKLLPLGVSEIFVYRFECLYERGPSEPDGEKLCGVCRSPHRVYIERLWKKMGMPQE